MFHFDAEQIGFPPPPRALGVCQKTPRVKIAAKKSQQNTPARKIISPLCCSGRKTLSGSSVVSPALLVRRLGKVHKAGPIKAASLKLPPRVSSPCKANKSVRALNLPAAGGGRRSTIYFWGVCTGFEIVRCEMARRRDLSREN